MLERERKEIPRMMVKESPGCQLSSRSSDDQFRLWQEDVRSRKVVSKKIELVYVAFDHSERVSWFFQRVRE